MNFIVMDRISPSTFLPIGLLEDLLLKAQMTIDPSYGMKMLWQCGHKRLIVCMRYYFYSCISLPAVLFEGRSIKAISFATRSILIGHSIGPPAPLWLSRNTTRAPTQGRLSNWYPVSYLQNWICCSLNICCLWGRCSRSSPVCVEISTLPNNTWTFGPFNEMRPWRADMFRVWWPLGSSSMQILI